MPFSSILLVLPALAAVLALIWLAQWGARSGGFARRLAPAQGGRVAVVQVLALDPRRRLHLLRCDDRHVLLLTGAAQDLVVGWLDREVGR